MKDIALFDDKNGGTHFLKSKDLMITESIYQAVYIIIFGGSKWWGNDYFNDIQYTDISRAYLSNIEYTSKSRLDFENKLKKALKDYLKFSTFDVTVSFKSSNIIGIKIDIDKIPNTTYFEWNTISDELIIQN